jgi:hypothetical protein
VFANNEGKKEEEEEENRRVLSFLLENSGRPENSG